MPINYDNIARYYDQHRSVGGPYIPRLLELFTRAPGKTALEIGAGTGNNTQALLEQSDCRLTALEPSSGMLDAAQKKHLNAAWLRADGNALPFTPAAFDFLFAVYVLHHIPALPPFFKGCHRVLRPGAPIAFITAPQDFIKNHPMNHYFPSFAKADLARFLPEETVCAALEKSGFTSLTTEYIQGPPRRVTHAYAERVAAKFISTYDLLPEEEFNTGVKRLHHDLEAANGLLDLDVTWRCALIHARKD